MKIEDVEKRLREIPVQIEQLKAEHNQLLGYKQALVDHENLEEPQETDDDTD